MRSWQASPFVPCTERCLCWRTRCQHRLQESCQTYAHFHIWRHLSCTSSSYGNSDFPMNVHFCLSDEVLALHLRSHCNERLLRTFSTTSAGGTAKKCFNLMLPTLATLEPYVAGVPPKASAEGTSLFLVSFVFRKLFLTGVTDGIAGTCSRLSTDNPRTSNTTSPKLTINSQKP